MSFFIILILCFILADLYMTIRLYVDMRERNKYEEREFKIPRGRDRRKKRKQQAAPAMSNEQITAILAQMQAGGAFSDYIADEDDGPQISQGDYMKLMQAAHVKGGADAV